MASVAEYALDYLRQCDGHDAAALNKYMKWKRWVSEQKRVLANRPFGQYVRDHDLYMRMRAAGPEQPELLREQGTYNYMCHKEKYECAAYDFHRYLKWKRWLEAQERPLSMGPFAHLVRDEALYDRVMTEVRKEKRRSQRRSKKKDQ